MAHDITGEHSDVDGAHLKSLGYEPRFRREMSLWANFSLGFTYLSPVAGIYSLFAFALATAGPAMIWTIVLVGAGQLLVGLVFGEVVSQYPIAGGVYQWSRRLWGRRWAWMTGWIYMAGIATTFAGVAYGAGPYVGGLLHVAPSTHVVVIAALVIVVISSVINAGGTKILSTMALFGFGAELVGSVAVGIWLLIADRHQSLKVVFHSSGAGSGQSYVFAFFAASLIGMFQFIGFEACGFVAEEVASPGRRIPKAMRYTLYIGSAAATFICLSLILAVPDLSAVVSGANTDPVGGIFSTAFGSVVSRIVFLIVCTSFVSCCVSLQATFSRLLYAYARDEMVVGSSILARFSERRHVPQYALLVAALIPSVIIAGSLFSTSALAKITAFATVGIYLAFMMVVVAALRARLLGWTPSGSFSLGRWGLPVNVGALIFGVAAVTNMSWARTPGMPWYDNYLVLLSGVLVVVSGLIYMAVTRHHDRGSAAAGDAHSQETRLSADGGLTPSL